MNFAFILSCMLDIDIRKHSVTLGEGNNILFQNHAVYLNL